MDKSHKRAVEGAAEGEAEGGPSKATRLAAPQSAISGEPGEPLTIVTYNANGLTPRVEKHLPELHAFVSERQPDVLLITEAHLPCSGAIRSHPEMGGKNSAAKVVNALLSGPLASNFYRPFFSLASGRKAGQLVLVRARGVHLVGERVLGSILDALLSHGATAAELPTAFPAERHQEEGRIVYLAFDSFDLLSVYVPNA
mmetsp:Transcript_33501/g.78789  ORF Transcript_33501/g.78789 Transcript_33501/m.78789 type:complete len:199 (-) Transcript_33501:667-1263(-)